MEFTINGSQSKNDFEPFSLSLSSVLNFDEDVEFPRSNELNSVCQTSELLNKPNDPVEGTNALPLEEDGHLFNLIKEDDFVELDLIDFSMDTPQPIADVPVSTNLMNSIHQVVELTSSTSPDNYQMNKTKSKGRPKGRGPGKRWAGGRPDGSNPLLDKIYEGRKRNTSLPIRATVAANISRISNRAMRKSLANFYHSSSRSHMLKKK